MFECMLIGNGAHRNLNFVEVRSTLHCRIPFNTTHKTKQFGHTAIHTHTHFASYSLEQL